MLFNELTRKTGNVFLCCVVIFVMALPGSLLAQKVIANNITPDVSQLKKQYGDKVGIVCLSSTDTYTFEYNAKDANPLIAKEVLEEQMMSLKDDYKFEPIFHYNDNTDIGKIKVYNKKDKPTDAYVFDIQNDKSSDFYDGDRIKTFDMLFENTGDKGGYSGETYYSDPKYLGRIFLRDEYPILEKTVTMSVPKWINVEMKEVNFNGYNIQKSVTTDPKTGNTVYTYTVKNLDRVHTEDHNVPTWDYMFPMIIPLFKSYNDPAGKPVPIMGSVADYYKWSDKLVQIAGNDPSMLKPVTDEIIKGKTNDIDKVKAIYYWVQDNIRYIAFENGISGYKPTPCQDVLKNKYGDCKCMANLLVCMLKLCGFDARHTWLATNQSNCSFSIPNAGCCNHCICTLFLNGKHYYLDGTEKGVSIDDNADRIQGSQVLIEDGDKYIVETIPVTPADKSKFVINKTMTLKNDLLTGDAHYLYTGESKTHYLASYSDIPSDKKEERTKVFVEKDSPDLTASNIVTSDMTNRDIPLTVGFNYTMKNQVNSFDNDTYISIDNDKFLGWLFDSTRDCDFKFSYRENVVVNDTLIVPQGYTIKHLPDNLDKETPNYIFKVKVTQAGNTIIYHKELQILNEILKKKDFKAWNADAGELKKIYDDQVILTKK